MDLVSAFHRTMDLCRSITELTAAIDESVKNQVVIFESDPISDTVNQISKGPVTQILSSKRSFDAARKYVKGGKKVCVLNFASFVTPGGGVTRGSRAQEESLCRISTLYPALIAESAAPFYRAHHAAIQNGSSSRKNNDDCIYTPGVKVICEDNFDCTLLPQNEWYTVDVITCAAPDQRYASFGMYHPTDSELYDVMVQRISRIYAVAASYHPDVLIMGAFGCGAFYNSPDIVASAFETAVKKFENTFECIEYAIASRPDDFTNYNAFKKIDGIIECNNF